MLEKFDDIVREMESHERKSAEEAWYDQKSWREMCQRLREAYKRDLGCMENMLHQLERCNKFLGIVIRDNLIPDPDVEEFTVSDLADDVWDAIHSQNEEA